MGGVRLSHRKKEIQRVKKQFIQAIPVICFFLFLFYTILLFFGVQYVIIVSFITVIFKTQFQKSFSIKKIGNIIITLWILAILAFFATLHPLLSLIINGIVPFFLVFIQASQFNQKGYFSSMMAFVFLQLRPVGWSGFLPLMGVLCYAMLILVIALLVASFIHRHKDSYKQIKKANDQLYELLQLILHHQDITQQIQAMLTTQQVLYKEAYQSRGITYVVTRSGKIHYMYALLIQRTIYFFESHYQDEMIENKEHQQLLQTFAKYIHVLPQALSNKDQYQQQGQLILQSTQSEENGIPLFIQNFLRLFMIILDNHEGKGHQPMKEWRLPEHLHLIQQLKAKFQIDRFEFRFACRLSFIMMISFFISTMTKWEHSYWLPLNAFLLLQPMYEDSTYRLKNRFIGTIIGCIGLYFLLNFFTSIETHFMIATIMISCLYISTPGTWVQAMFSTCFALTLTTMALQQEVAIELRISYVILAIFLVLLVSRFLFPTSMTSQFHYNLQRIFHMQHAYLRILYFSLDKQIDYGVICDALTSYHMVYAQLDQYVKKMEGKEKAFYQDILFIFWHMAAEMERLLFLVNQQRIGLDNQKELQNYIKVNHYVLQQIQLMMHLGVDTILDINHTTYIRKLDEEPSLSQAMEQYAKDISKLYYRIVTYYIKNNQSNNRYVPHFHGNTLKNICKHVGNMLH